MNNSDSSQCGAEQIVDRLLGMLDESRLAEIIDEPIDIAAESFHCRTGTLASCKEFHDLTAEFIRYVQERTTALPGRWSRPQALDEAVALLQQAYAAAGAKPYDAALQEALDELQGGMQVVLARLVSAIKQRQRQNYKCWVVARHIDPLDWETRRTVASILLERCVPFLPAPPKGYRYQPEELADQIPGMLDLILATEHLARQMFSRPLSSAD